MFLPSFKSFSAALLFAAVLPQAAAEASAPLDSAVLLPLPIVSARLAIVDMGGGYHLVVVSGTSTGLSRDFGVRVYGDDTWFDDLLFNVVGARTDPSGAFSVSRVVHRNTLNEDWEGQDEIYAIVDISGAGSARTNTISRSF